MDMWRRGCPSDFNGLIGLSACESYRWGASFVALEDVVGRPLSEVNVFAAAGERLLPVGTCIHTVNASFGNLNTKRRKPQSASPLERGEL